MRRLVIFLVTVLSTFGFTLTPAGAITPPDGTAALLYLGQAQENPVTANHCAQVPYQVRNAYVFDLEYRGPDGSLYTAEGIGRIDSGDLGVCADDLGPAGFYWLRRVIVQQPDSVWGNATYKRYDGSVSYEHGPSGNSGLNLGHADLMVQN